MPFILRPTDPKVAVYAVMRTELAEQASMLYPLKQRIDHSEIDWLEDKNYFVIKLPEPKELPSLMDLCFEEKPKAPGEHFHLSLGEVIAFNWFCSQPSTLHNITVNPDHQGTCYPFGFDASLSDDEALLPSQIIKHSLSGLNKEGLVSQEVLDSIIDLAQKEAEILKGFMEELERLNNIPLATLFDAIKLEEGLDENQTNDLRTIANEYINLLETKKSIAHTMLDLKGRAEEKVSSDNPRRIIVSDDNISKIIEKLTKEEMLEHLMKLEDIPEDIAKVIRESDEIPLNVAAKLATQYASFFNSKLSATYDKEDKDGLQNAIADYYVRDAMLDWIHPKVLREKLIAAKSLSSPKTTEHEALSVLGFFSAENKGSEAKESDKEKSEVESKDKPIVPPTGA